MSSLNLDILLGLEIGVQSLMKPKLSKKDLIVQLSNQLAKIDDFCKMYDSGKELIAQEISVKLRILFHNTYSSKSLLKQLRLEHIQFVDTGKKFIASNLSSHWGLISAQSKLGPGEDGAWKFVPRLDKSEERNVHFDNWWNGKKVIADMAKKAFTRRKLILELANTDGGAHVDPDLQSDYHALTRENSIGWFNLEIVGSGEPLNNPVLPSIRQIAYETLLTFERVDVEKESKIR